jgi:hypothetical protein
MAPLYGVLLAEMTEQHLPVGRLGHRQPGRKRLATEAAAVELVCFWLRYCSLHSPRRGPVRERFCLRCLARKCELIHALWADKPDPVRLSGHIGNSDVLSL